MSAQLLAKLRREYVRQAIRDGKTFAQIMREYGGVTKRMIEDERKALFDRLETGALGPVSFTEEKSGTASGAGSAGRE